MRPAKLLETWGRVRILAEPVNKKRPARGSSSTDFLMARRRSGTRCLRSSQGDCRRLERRIEAIAHRQSAGGCVTWQTARSRSKNRQQILDLIRACWVLNQPTVLKPTLRGHSQFPTRRDSSPSLHSTESDFQKPTWTDTH